MVNIRQVVLSLLSLPFSQPVTQEHFSHSSQPSKSIAIVGAGSAGLAILKTLLDLPEPTRRNWEIVLYEQRRSVGGIWLPDPREPNPPELPETPLYPLLRTNTPHPSMTYPGFPFPPMTALYPTHDYVERYHTDYVSRHNLTRYIRINNTVLSSSWMGNSSAGKWNITVRDHQDSVTHKSFDHLIAANGHNQYPYIPTWPGQDEWLRNSPTNGPKREILHTLFWRNPDKYTGRSVLIVGGGASGRDAALHIAPLANTLYLSLKENKSLSAPLPYPTVNKPPISHFTAQRVFFTDGTSAADIDALILGTGYEFRIPFLDAGNALLTDPDAHQNETHTQRLTTNLRYIFPLYEHIFALAPQYPPTALAFVGLPMLVANCPSDVAQSLLVAHALANASVLPSRDDMLTRLRDKEAALREQGLDPYHVGHRLVGDGADHDYQDDLVQYLKDRGAIPDDGKLFVEPWRRRVRINQVLLRRGWARVEDLGIGPEWLQGIETEVQWADMMERLAAWEENMEREEGSLQAEEWDFVSW